MEIFLEEKGRFVETCEENGAEDKGKPQRGKENFWELTVGNEAVVKGLTGIEARGTTAAVAAGLWGEGLVS